MIANEYFQSYADYFWQWEDNAEVLAIPLDSTIAYRDFIKEILDKLSNQGIPPFGSLIAAIIATNSNGAITLDFLYENFNEEIKKEGGSYLKDAFLFLKLLSGIPDEYKKGNKRILLLQTLFENCHNILSIKKSKDIIRWYYFNKENASNFTVQKQLNPTIYSRDFRTISLLSSRFRSVADIINKIAALPEIKDVVIQKEEISKGNNKQTFIDELIADNRTFQLGILAERILSGLNVPFHRSLADQQPLGGVSDITNKGSFDKLLLSEFANDDVLFLSRLANNEALYIEREIPPSNNKLKRVFLIDVSLRTWGTPKLIAFATMLAIAKTPNSNIECSVFAIGYSYNPINLNSIHTLIDGLQIVEGCADASEGLAMYFKEYPKNADTELFFLTESTAAKLTSMYNSMSKYNSFINYCIHIDFEGNIDVFKKQKKSLTHNQHIKLPMEELSKKKPSLIKSNLRDESVTNYPILVRNPTNVKLQLIAPNSELYQITNEKNLIKKYDRFAKYNEKGWVILYEDIPFSNGIFEIVELDNGELVLFMFSPQKKVLVLLNINTGNKHSITFNEYQPNHNSIYKNFVFKNQCFYHKNDHVWRISMDGKVELVTIIDPAIFSVNKPLQSIPDKINTQGIFKNIGIIYINENSNLVFNVHELLLKSNVHFKLDKAQKVNPIHEATKIKTNEFLFEDGSSIEVNRSGILILKSSDTKIPLIYIPSIIDSTLGMAAGTDFTGNVYYYKDPFFKIILKDPGKNIQQLVQSIHEHTEYSSSECEEIAHSKSWPITLIESVSLTKTNKITQALELIGVTVETKEMTTNGEKSTIISPSLFNDKYIQAFVKTIQSYGIKN